MILDFCENWPKICQNCGQKLDFRCHFFEIWEKNEGLKRKIPKYLFTLGVIWGIRGIRGILDSLTD